METAARVLDPGPLNYSEIELFRDSDLEHALTDDGFDPDTTAYRLIEIPVGAIVDTKTMPWAHMGTGVIDALRSGARFPPIVVMPVKTGWTLLDGVNRTYAHWALQRSTIRAYELLTS